MSDIQPGDVVVCIRTASNSCGRRPRNLLRLHALYRVSGTYLSEEDQPALTLFGMDPSPFRGWSAWCFRKIDAADEQFTARIRASKPINTPVSA